MGFEGHTLDMINRIKQNKALLQSKKDQIKKIREMYIAHYRMSTSPQPVPPNLSAIKAEIRKELYQKRKKARILTICILVLVVSGLIWAILHFPFQTFMDTFW